MAASEYVVMESISSSLSADTREAVLVALRGRLAWEIDRSESGREIASLSNQLRATLQELDAIRQANAEPKESPAEESNEGGDVDEIAARRAERLGRVAAQ